MPPPPSAAPKYWLHVVLRTESQLHASAFFLHRPFHCLVLLFPNCVDGRSGPAELALLDVI